MDARGVPATKLGFIVTGADKRTGAAYGYGYGKQPKLVTSEQQPETGPSFSDSPPTAERGGKARSRSRSSPVGPSEA